MSIIHAQYVAAQSMGLKLPPNAKNNDLHPDKHNCFIVLSRSSW
jgi:hypothetical protein